ncbi:MAG: hypothetical protein U0519_03050 [Candidatus Gracilibacteria bacterium]
MATPDGGGGSGGSDAGTGGSGGSGGSGGVCSGTTAVCATYPGCGKTIHLSLGTVIIADSSPNDSTCQGTPFTVNPSTNEDVAYAVQLTPGQLITWTFAAGKSPKYVNYKCVTSPVPGPAPTRDQLYGTVYTSGYVQVAAAPVSNPLTFGVSCPSNWAVFVLSY